MPACFLVMEVLVSKRLLFYPNSFYLLEMSLSLTDEVVLIKGISIDYYIIVNYPGNTTSSLKDKRNLSLYSQLNTRLGCVVKNLRVFYESIILKNA